MNMSACEQSERSERSDLDPKYSEYTADEKQRLVEQLKGWAGSLMVGLDGRWLAVE